MQLDQQVITPTGKTGRVVETGLQRARVRVRLDPFTSHWAGNITGRVLSGMTVVYQARDLKVADRAEIAS